MNYLRINDSKYKYMHIDLYHAYIYVHVYYIHIYVYARAHNCNNYKDFEKSINGTGIISVKNA